MKKYCENYICDCDAVKTVPVSEAKYGDATRDFCAACDEAYTIGVQHGKFRFAETKEMLKRIQGTIATRKHDERCIIEVYEAVKALIENLEEVSQ